MAKIGFLLNHNESNDDNKKQKNTVIPAQEEFKKFVSSKYKPFGASNQVVFRTSRELQYECREMCEPSLVDVAKVMEELGYKCDQFMGQFTWILYEELDIRY